MANHFTRCHVADFRSPDWFLNDPVAQSKGWLQDLWLTKMVQDKMQNARRFDISLSVLSFHAALNFSINSGCFSNKVLISRGFENLGFSRPSDVDTIIIRKKKRA